MVARSRERRARRPTAFGGIIRFVCARVLAIETDAAHGVDLAIKHSRGESPARGQQGRNVPPVADFRIIFVASRGRCPASIEIATYEIELAVPPHRRRMMDLLRDRLALALAVRFGIINFEVPRPPAT